MKVKALRNFQSVILSMEKDEVRELDIDNAILEDWTASGLIEEVKSGRKKSADSKEVPEATDENLVPIDVTVNENQ